MVLLRVQQWWNGYHFIGSLSFILAQNLKALKVDLKKWNKQELGGLSFRMILPTELMGMDAREETRALA